MERKKGGAISIGTEQEGSIFQIANKTVGHVSFLLVKPVVNNIPLFLTATDQPTAFTPWIYPSSYLHIMHQIDLKFGHGSGVVPAMASKLH